MRGQGSQTAIAAAREQQWQVLRSLIRELEEERDLRGLAVVAEMGLTALRQMCERPVTCASLNDMLEQVRSLKLDAFEQGQDG